MSEIPEMTPQDGSLESATSALTGLLSRVEEKEKETGEPEPLKAEKSAETQQAQAETDEETPSIEPAESEGTEEAPKSESQPRAFTVKVAGQDIEVTEDELLKGYSRTEDYTRKTQELARQRKEFEERDVAAVRAERQQYVETLDKLKAHVQASVPKEPDWATLKAQLSPEQYAERLDAWRVTKDELTRIETAQAEIRSRQEKDAEAGFKQHMAKEQQVLWEKLPDLADATKGPALTKALVDTALSLGFSPEEVEGVADHRAFLMLNEVRLYRAQQAKAPKIENKIQKAIAQSAPGSKSSNPKADEFKEANQRLKSTGKLDDAALAIAAWANKKSA